MTIKQVKISEHVEEAPEGGWGYVIMLSVVFGCVNYIERVFVSEWNLSFNLSDKLATFGYMTCLGIMFADFLTDLGLHTKALTMLPSCFFICFSPVGLFTNYLFNRFSVRSVGICGALIFCTGSVLVVFVRSLNELLIAYSLMQGKYICLPVYGERVLLSLFINTIRFEIIHCYGQFN